MGRIISGICDCVSVYMCECLHSKTTRSSADADEPSNMPQIWKTTYSWKFEHLTWPWLCPFGGHCVIPRLILHTANQRTEFEDPSFSHSRGTLGKIKFKMDYVTWPCPFQGWFVIHRLGRAVDNLHTKFEVFYVHTLRRYKRHLTNWVVRCHPRSSVM